MRAVIDTNVLISALFWGGRPRRVIDLAVSGRFQAITSAGLLLELEEVLANDFDVPPDRLDLIIRDTLSYIETVVATDLGEFPLHPPTLERLSLRDRDDIEVIATALAGRADCIITGDGDLLSVDGIGGIAIVSPARFLDALESAEPP